MIGSVAGLAGAVGVAGGGFGASIRTSAIATILGARVGGAAGGVDEYGFGARINKCLTQ